MLLLVFLALVFAFAAMAEAWAKILEEEGLSPDLREKITSTYKDANVFRSCFHHASDIDKYAQKLLTSGATPVATEEDWSFHPPAGALRRIREKSMVTHQPAVAAGVPPGSSNLLPLVQPLVANCKLNEAERERLIKEFGKKYPGVCLARSVLPSLGYLQLVQAQCTSASWGWHPWRKILSEEAVQEVQSCKGYQKREMVDLVAEAAGLCSDEWDQELQAAPMKVFQLLCVRSHAYALCGGGHLHSWMSYVQRFIGYYMKKPGPGFRHMTPREAEEVDKEVLSEVFHLVYHDGNTLDAALEALVREDLLRIKMVSVPKLAKQPAPKPPKPPASGDRAPIKRRRLDDEARAKSKDCFAWKNTGSCKFGDGCKFAHPKPFE